MTDAPVWEELHASHWDTTERLAIPGGWLVRSVWRKAVEMGQPHLDGSAVVFVPASDKELQHRQLAAQAALCVILEQESHAKEAEVVEAEAVEASGRHEQDRLAGQDHGPRRRRKGE